MSVGSVSCRTIPVACCVPLLVTFTLHVMYLSNSERELSMSDLLTSISTDFFVFCLFDTPMLLPAYV